MSRSYLQPRTRLKLNSSARARAADDSGLLGCRIERLLLVMTTLLVTQLTLIVQRSAYADPAPVELSKSCVIEGQPQGLSLVVDDRRAAHLVYFTTAGQLSYMRLSELSGSFTAERLVLDFLDPAPAHTRMTLTDQGIAFCYYDPRSQRVMVIEQSEDNLVISSALEAPSATYCDIERSGARLFVSAVINGQLTF